MSRLDYGSAVLAGLTRDSRQTTFTINFLTISDSPGGATNCVNTAHSDFHDDDGLLSDTIQNSCYYAATITVKWYLNENQ